MRAEQEAVAMAKYEAHGSLSKLRNANGQKFNTVCGDRECMSCARQVENTGSMELECGTPGHVITQVHFAVWGVAADQPDWHLSDSPGMCGHPEFGLSNRSGHNTTAAQNAQGFNYKGMRKTKTRDTLRVVREQCVGLTKCSIHPSPALLGRARWSGGERHALSVAVNCSDSAAYRESMTTTLIESYGLKCTPPLGCPTCMMTDSTKETPNRLQCYGDGIIADIQDAVYGAEQEQPPFYFVPTAAACNLTGTDRTIPKGSMCRASRSRVIRAVKRRCLGRQNCAITTEDLKDMFPDDPCPGLTKRLTVIGTCMMTQLPLDVVCLQPPNPKPLNFKS